MTRQQRRAEIAELLAYKEQEQLTYRELEEETGVSRHTLAHWAWRFRREEKADARASRKIKSSFVELIVADEETTESDGAIDIEVDGSTVVRVRAGFDPATLRKVVDALRGRC